MLRAKSLLASLMVITFAIAVPAAALDHIGLPPTGSSFRVEADAPETMGLLAADLSAYAGLGTWVDMFNAWPWDNPGKAAKAMAGRGVTTLYLETSNYRKANDLYRPTQMGKFLEAAHANGMKVVAWYVPGFSNMKRDKRRSKAAIDFRSPLGEAFDSFALDIEATAVRDISTRNARAVRLSEHLRDYVGNGYPMGAIVPEAGALYWPSFPYSDINKSFDVFLPMAYYTYRVNGAAAVRSFTNNNVSTIRKATGDPDVPIHVIGGLGGVGTVREIKAFVNKLIDKGVSGGSFYDFPITKDREWEVLAKLAS